MTVHLVSVGASLLKAMDNLSSIQDLDRDLRSVIRQENPTRCSPGHRPEADRNRSGPVRGCFRRTRRFPHPRHRQAQRTHRGQRRRNPGLWPARISAELDTLKRAPGSWPLRPPTDTHPGDIAVLLATDTVEGLTAALWNALALTAGDLSRVEYLQEPDQTPATARDRIPVLIVRVPA
ncbi:hypothetical protein ACR6C2_08250 [Streptomyces sp. INA 01156]